ncbi:MAG: hypothetical protein V1822_04410 [Candidatus Micrarchaeota archaeon]
MEMVVRFKGITQNILDILVAEGYYKTKSEAIRAGVLSLAKEYKILEKARDDFEVRPEYLEYLKKARQQKAKGHKSVDEYFKGL